jgi:hypothetical protein
MDINPKIYKHKNGERDNSIHCSSCGKLLERPDQICDDCDISLGETKSEEKSYPFSPVKTKVFTKVCPSCGIWFSRNKMPHEIWPKNARWYTYQGSYPACPKCRTMLESRHLPARKYFFVAYLLVLFSSSLKSYTPPYGYILWLVINAVIFSVFAIATYREYKDDALFKIKKIH